MKMIQMPYPSEVWCSICVWCFLDQLVDTLEVVGHHLGILHGRHLDVQMCSDVEKKLGIKLV